MIDYTKVALKKIFDEFKQFVYVFQVCVYILYTLYLIYAIATKSGILAVNIILLVFSLAYLIFFIVYNHRKQKNKTLKKIVTEIFKWSKRAIKLFTIGVALYGVYETSKNVNPLSVVLSALMVVGFVFDLLFDLIIRFISKRIHFVYEAIQADVETITKPFTAVKSFFKREVEVPPPPTKNRLILDELVATAKAEREEKRQELKLSKKEKKRLVKARKKEEKLQKKELASIPAHGKDESDA